MFFLQGKINQVLLVCDQNHVAIMVLTFVDKRSSITLSNLLEELYEFIAPIGVDQIGHGALPAMFIIKRKFQSNSQLKFCSNSDLAVQRSSGE